MTPVAVGAIIPNSGAVALDLGIETMGRAAEEAGASGLWVSDHVLMADRPVSDYPYSVDGRMTWQPAIDYLEALSCCAFLAGVTTRCRIGTAALVLPQRNVLQLAKEIATIDALSGGRLSLGLGAGWNEAEMTALGWDFATRGGRMDEMIGVLRDAWSGRTAGFRGEHLEVEGGLLLHPRPVAPAGPPLLIGGLTRRAMERAATLGDGWLALAYVERWDPAALGAKLATLSTLAAAAGRAERPSAVLKLHCDDESFDRLVPTVASAFDLGFDEVIVELPWSRGVAAAGDLLRDVLESR